MVDKLGPINRCFTNQFHHQFSSYCLGCFGTSAELLRHWDGNYILHQVKYIHGLTHDREGQFLIPHTQENSSSPMSAWDEKRLCQGFPASSLLPSLLIQIPLSAPDFIFHLPWGQSQKAVCTRRCGLVHGAGEGGRRRYPFLPKTWKAVWTYFKKTSSLNSSANRFHQQLQEPSWLCMSLKVHFLLQLA